MMLTFYLPNSHQPERRYCAEVISSFFDSPCEIIFEDRPNYALACEGRICLTVTDEFFAKRAEGQRYVEQDIPIAITWIEHALCPERNIPVLFGHPKLIYEHNVWHCESDFFAAIFFMLTRFEEQFALPDAEGRCPATESLAYRFGFLNRPIVNEYVELIRNILSACGFSLATTGRYELIPTHDVDVFSPPAKLKTFMGDLLKRRNLKLFANRFYDNYFDYFSWLMDVSEKANTKSRFYVMSSMGKGDANYLPHMPNVKNIFESIAKRGHVLGFHPGFNTANNNHKWAEQKLLLENALGIVVEEGRQHYLFSPLPQMWRIWDDNNMKIDSSLSYADYEGFRCGTGSEFNVFDIDRRKKLALRERPLIVMEMTLLYYQKLSMDEISSVLCFYNNISKRYKMPFTILFHNSTFWKTNVYKGINNVYTDFFDTYSIGKS